MPQTATVIGGSFTGADDRTARRFAESAHTYSTGVMPTAQFHAWLAERALSRKHRVDLIALDDLDGWSADPETGNLGHRSGRFYTIEGLEVVTGHRHNPTWSQPIILQPEIGILGILVKEFNGVLHCLMQAKMEPGNVNGIQLSPTVQATPSNYTRVHQGNAIPYLEHFITAGRGRVVADTLQSEQGAWFLQKRNRNMIVEVTEDVPVLDGFCWLTVGQLHELLAVENLVNMDTRSVMSIIPLATPIDRPSLLNEDSFRGALLRSLSTRPDPNDATGNLVSWFTDVKSRRTLRRRPIPLHQTKGWLRTSDRIHHEDERYFSVVGVRVEADDREVTSWSQPMIAPASRGVLALLTRQVNGVLHALVQAHTQAGTFDVVEMAPTVQCSPENYDEGRPPFLDYVLSAPASQIRFDVVHSEEGGRFFQAENRCLIIEVDDAFPTDVPDGYVWATISQLTDLTRHGHYFNVEARCLLTCLHTLW
ncbi:NDP-hexose 2,3-dehydratase family protein [Micromonospora sp. NPDC050200]|uniref:NDP-hexose 2,3-dehydratase family protein n=1 Tax=Micromonospora sp. NPDC050200 TaxID=3155664 RepID=UPI00341084A5